MLYGKREQKFERTVCFVDQFWPNSWMQYTCMYSIKIKGVDLHYCFLKAKKITETVWIFIIHVITNINALQKIWLVYRSLLKCDIIFHYVFLISYVLLTNLWLCWIKIQTNMVTYIHVCFIIDCIRISHVITEFTLHLHVCIQRHIIECVWWIWK